MESLGNKLKEVRESKDLTLDYISGETNIAIRYLDALEREDFSVFPGEPYLLGFLKNYGEYLGFEAAEVLSLYRALKIQEQPVPVEQLLHSPSSLPKVLVGISAAILLLGAGGAGYYFITHFSRPEVSSIPMVRSPVEYVMDTDSLDRRFYQRDTILVSSGDDQYKLELSKLGEMVTIVTPDRTVLLELGQEITVDLNQDGTAELRITALDFDKKDPDAGALLRFNLEGFYAAAEDPGFTDAANSGGAASGNMALPITGLANATVIFSSSSPYPFTLQIAFQGDCMFRWEILLERDRRDRNERYYQRSDEPLNIQAQNGIRAWASNAQAAKIQVIGGGRTVPLELGAAGEVVVADVRWVRDDENRYRLVMVRLD